MVQFGSKHLKGVLVVLGAIGLSTIAIQASDVVRYGSSGLLGSVATSDRVCPEHTVPYQIDGQSVCVDTYEASAAPACPHQTPRSGRENTENIQTTECMAVSRPDAMPLRYVSFTHADQFCARAGKRLLTPREWHVLARDIDMSTAECVTNQPGQGPALTGTADCVTSTGVHDLIGNVWEWVDAEVVDGQYQGRAVPSSGYVSGVDRSGVVVSTADEADQLYDNAYAWTEDEGVTGMVRGGFYGSGSDAGRYAQNLSVSLDIETAGIGFRCVADRS